MIELAPWAWSLLALAALFVGVSKTALPGISTVSVAIFASVLPAKNSTAAVLLLLIAGDVMALALYRRHADWRTLLRLMPAVLLGLVAGAVFLRFADDMWVRKAIGVILLVLVGITLWNRRRAEAAERRAGVALATTYGGLAGFTTMVANAGGPVMSMYFIAARFPKEAFLGTAAWFFAIVNLVKVPFAVGLGLLTPPFALLSLVLVPAVVAGGALGRVLVARMDQVTFERIVTVLTVLGALQLVLF